jgi:hypothetical protein
VGRAEAGPIAHLDLESQPGDFIGQGQNWDITYTPENSDFFSAQINQTLPDGSPTYVTFVLGTVTSGTDNTFAILQFGTNQLGIPLQPGTYTDAERAPFADPGHPGLDVSFQNRGCNTLTGSFTINQVSFFTDASNTLQIGSFSASFEQHCEGATPALFGTFTFQASSVPEPSTLSLGLVCTVIALVNGRKLRARR